MEFWLWQLLGLPGSFVFCAFHPEAALANTAFSMLLKTTMHCLALITM